MTYHEISNCLFPSESELYVSTTSFDCLPSEVVARILSNLCLADKKNARLVDQHWLSVIEDEYSANPIALRPLLSNNSLACFLNTRKIIDYVRFKNITRIMPRTWESRFPQINQLDIGEGNSEQHLANIFKNGCEDTEYLNIAEYALEKITRRTLTKVLDSGDVKWGHLGKLGLRVLVTHSEYYKSLKHMETMIPLLKLAIIPTLRELELEFELEYFFDLEERFQALIVSVYKFLHHHTCSLKILRGQIENSGTRQLNIPKMPRYLRISLKLESFGFIFRRIVNIAYLVCPGVCGTQLKTLEVCVVRKGMTFREIVEPDPHHPDLYIQIGKIIQANASTLQTISLDLQQIRLSWLQNCFSLESLKFREIENTLIHESSQEFPTAVRSLKSLSVNNQRLGSRYGLPNPLQEFIIQNSKTLENITLFRASQEDDPWLRACVNLKTLIVIVFTNRFLHTKINFPNLKSLETPLSRRLGTGIWEWLKQAAKNLEQITILGSFTDLTTIQSLLNTLPMLKRIIFSIRGRGYGTNLESIIAKFCQSKPGLTLLPKKYDMSQTWRVICVDRRVFQNNLSTVHENQN